MADEPLIQLASQVYTITPRMLAAHEKVKNPFPNVDARSGFFCGITVYKRLSLPIERPKSLSTTAYAALM
ncbi:hypothetical protein BO82DRAFT_403465 [Aspergillus uvarum CBS 121591]|uniref:Uncharacterized protein n=1 Tax=Aspergillus uvarum CBS 121591 TaxID=1448315 RepID=A0A319DLA2_9EURO|nr:hypothetical protein BO82DRAFT_403465 [Aspergillus uvarum CBS 121591]PYH80232.1 hypothetical protein BO82DRAFT_403465 [Aspergillus uvarum CBS 121591]